MTRRRTASSVWVFACVLTLAPTDVRGQGRGALPPGTAVLPLDPITGPVVANAPYAGDAVTTVTQILNDGTRIEQKAEAKFYRDTMGRVRREQTILGLGWTNGSAQSRTVVTILPTPGDNFAYTLDPVARTARRVPRGLGAFGLRLNGSMLSALDAVVGAIGRGAVPLPPPTPPGSRSEESLGTRQIEGVRATGRKTTTTIPQGQIGNDRPIEITEERWESPDLRVLVYSRFSDPRTGVVEFKLTNINRTEPAADLFMVPSDYTIIESGAAGRGVGRAGARGGRQ